MLLQKVQNTDYNENLTLKHHITLSRLMIDSELEAKLYVMNK